METKTKAKKDSITFLIDSDHLKQLKETAKNLGLSNSQTARMILYTRLGALNEETEGDLE